MATKTKIAKGNTVDKKKASGKNAKSKVEKTKVSIELYSVQISAGKLEVDITDGICADDVDEARSNVFVSGLDVDGLGVAECTVDGKTIDLDIAKCERVVNYGYSIRKLSYDKPLIYSLDDDKASWCFEFEVEGKFDPKLLKLCCEEVLQPGRPNVTLVTSLFYVENRLGYKSFMRNKGASFWLFNKDKYARIDCDDYSSDKISSLRYGSFWFDDGDDLWCKAERLGDWEDWDESTWGQFEYVLTQNKKDVIKELKELFGDSCCGCDDKFNVTKFLVYALKRSKVWSRIASGLLNLSPSEFPFELIEDDQVAKGIAEYCNRNCRRDDSKLYEDLDSSEDGSVVNSWALFLKCFPHLADYCDTWDCFSGSSACWLLRFHPQLANKFDMLSIGDASSQYWGEGEWSGDYQVALGKLVEEQPQFAKYYDCQGDGYWDVERWGDWPASKWERFEKILAEKDEDTIKGLVRFFRDYTSSSIDIRDYEFDETGFFVHALKRSKVWIRIVNAFWFASPSNFPLELIEDEQVAKGIAEYCNSNRRIYGSKLYEENDLVVDSQDEFEVNRWAHFLKYFPCLGSKCDSWEAFCGWSACWLLCHQPQFADKFSMDKLGDASSQYWDYKYNGEIAGDFDDSWEMLIEAQPQFAKYYKKGKKGK